MGGEVEGWEPPLLASAPPPLSLGTALERVVAVFFFFFGICSFADDDTTHDVVTGPFRFALPQAFE